MLGNLLKGTATLKANESEIQALLNHAICLKPDQNRMKSKKVTDVYQWIIESNRGQPFLG